MDYQSKDNDVLNLSRQSLKTVPKSILKNLNITELDLSYNELTELPEFITELKNLKVLKLRNNKFTIAPELILQFKYLKVLSLSENQITVIPSSFRRLSKLEKFDIGSNPLIEFPEWIDELYVLKDLGIYALKLKHLPDVVTRIKYLETLSIDDNDLITLPDSIDRLKYLKELWAEDNNIEFLPESIGNLSNLEMINFGVNRIKYLPKSICNLRRLKYLSVNENNIQELPNNIGKLSNLESLYISYNQISSLPKSFFRLNIRQLDVWFEGNFYTETAKKEIKEFFPDIEDYELEVDDTSPDEELLTYNRHQIEKSEPKKRFILIPLIALIIVLLIIIFSVANKEDPITRANKKAATEYNTALKLYQKKRDKMLKSSNSLYVYTNDTSELKAFLNPNVEFYTNPYAPYYSNIQSKADALNRFLNDNSLGFNVVLDNKRVKLIQAKIFDSTFNKESIKKYSLVVDYKMTKREIEIKKKHTKFSSIQGIKKDSVFNTEKIMLTSKELEDKKLSTGLKQLLAPIIDLNNKEYHFYFSPYDNNYSKQEFAKAIEDFKIMFLKENANKNIGEIKEIKIDVE